MRIKKDGVLALGVARNDVMRYREVAEAYGSVHSVLVNADGGFYRILAGQERLEGMAGAGVREIPAIVTRIDDPRERTRLALWMSVLDRSGNALSQGAMIAELVAGGVSRRELLAFLRKSKSWLSKRESLAENLSPEARDLVSGGIVSPSAAERISRLPKSAQFDFARKAAEQRLGKSDIGTLVAMYQDEGADEETRRGILENPALFVPEKAEKAGKARKGKGGAGRGGFPACIRYAASFLSKTIEGMVSGDLDDVAKEAAGIEKLRGIALRFVKTLDWLRASLGPEDPQIGKISPAETGEGLPAETGESLPGETGEGLPGETGESLPGETGKGKGRK
jgi:ParB family chromosome partitioning protein